ncbi:MAG: pyridoxal phosphate-dependent aminotransferase [Acidobacteriota bacterium]
MNGQRPTANGERFSRRTNWNPITNRLSIARAKRPDALDLTISNPTLAALPYPLDELSDAMARAARAPYDPQPLGLPSAREAVAREIGCHAAEVVLTASTSEGYSFLFKLLCDPGDNVVTATPSYPLIEHLAAMEMIEVRHFPLEFHRRWELDAARIPIDGRTRAIVVVNPNNPTGSFVTAEEWETIWRLGIPVISDEVFFDYPLDGVRAGRPTSAGGTPALHFALGGLSKSAGLPHYKLGWIRVPDPHAVAALELIADNFLSVATPVQVALPEILALAPRIRAAIAERTRVNLATAKRLVSGAAQLLPAEGGWSAVIRVPSTMSDEEFALDALERHGVVVHPGYFFDFDRDGYFVVSLLTPCEVFFDGLSRLLAS